MTARCFRFGVINELSHSPAAWVEAARRTEDLGYSTFLIRDHFAPDFFGPQLAPIAALTAAACATTRLRVGSLVIDNDYRHPVVLAKEIATLDGLAGGRVELGLGAGWLQKEYAQAGMPFDPPGTRIGRLEESIRVLKGLFADGPLSFDGAHYRISELDGFPKPVQRPHPPILIGAGSPRMLRLAGREADIVGLLTTSTRTGTLVDDPAERTATAIAEKIARVREGAGARFRNLELSLVATVTVTDHPRREAEALIRTRGWAGVRVEDDVLEMPAGAAGVDRRDRGDARGAPRALRRVVLRRVGPSARRARTGGRPAGRPLSLPLEMVLEAQTPCGETRRFPPG
jgi:probable F420-dependent oxidoreductase